MEKPKISMRTLVLWALIIGMFFLVWRNLGNQGQMKELIYSEFLNLVQADKVSEVVIQGNKIEGKLKEGGKFRALAPDDADLIKLLKQKEIKITAKAVDGGFWSDPLMQILLFAVLPILILVFFFRKMGQGMAGQFKNQQDFGKSRAKLLTQDTSIVTFADVAGIDEAKQDLQEVIDFLRNPKKFSELGAKIPKGVLLMGPPGTGKTLLGKAVAGEAKVPFFIVNASSFVEMFVGVGAARVRDLFEEGKKNAPCIIFIDEIDAVGRYRGAGVGGGHDEREQTLNQLLAEMDGFGTNSGVIMMAATNRPDVLDPALLRAGRFDRQIVVPMPDIRGREAILKVHVKQIILAPDVALSVIARGTPGFSGADLANLVNEAALYAVRQDKKQVEMSDFEAAKDKVIMGAERKGTVINPDEKKIIAFHEAGHALVAKLLPGTDPVHKVTIIPRGLALGLTWQLPLEDKHLYSQEFILNEIAILLGGRVAEELALKSISTGAGTDLERATAMARKMVCEWGMSRLGLPTFGKKSQHIFLGKELAEPRDYSEETAAAVDKEIKEIMTERYKLAKQLLNEHRPLLNALSDLLLQKETVEGAEIDELVSKTAEP